jgi:hypothetical protein
MFRERRHHVVPIPTAETKVLHCLYHLGRDQGRGEVIRVIGCTFVTCRLQQRKVFRFMDCGKNCPERSQQVIACNQSDPVEQLTGIGKLAADGRSGGRCGG